MNICINDVYFFLIVSGTQCTLHNSMVFSMYLLSILMIPQVCKHVPVISKHVSGIEPDTRLVTYGIYPQLLLRCTTRCTNNVVIFEELIWLGLHVVSIGGNFNHRIQLSSFGN